MSIATEITRIQNAKSSIITTLTEKGVTVPTGTKLEGINTLISTELVKPTGTVNTTPKVTAQTVNVAEYEYNAVGAIYEEVSSSATMDSYLTDNNNRGKMYKFTGTTDTKYTNDRLYICEPVPVPIPTVASNLTYNGSEQSPTITGYDATVMTKSGDVQTDAGNYMVTFALNTGETWTDGTTAAKSFSWSIAKLSLTIPSTSGTYTYNGSEQTVLVNNFNSTYETAANVAKINADDYTATFSLKDTNNTQWADNTITNKTSDWSIAAKSISGATVTLESSSFTYDGTAKTQNVISVVIDSLAATYTVSDNVQTNAGEYTLTCTGTGNFTGIQTVSWSIAKAVGTLSISPISVSFNNSTLINTVTVTSNCLGTINVSSLSGITSSISGTIVTLTADGSTAISSTMTISVTPDSNHNAPSDVSLSVSAVYVFNVTCNLTNCTGTRASDDMAGVAGNSYTYYTQNAPV